MTMHQELPDKITAMRLTPVAAAQLYELALDAEQTLDEIMNIALHRAYLLHLDRKREAALRTLRQALGTQDSKDDLSF